MTLNFVVVLTAAIANFIIGIFVFIKNPRSYTNRFFVLLAIALIGWSTANYFSVILDNPERIFLSVKTVFFFVVLQNTAYFLLFNNFPNNKLVINKKILSPFVLFSLLTFGLIFTNLVLKGYKVSGNSIALVPGPLIPLFILHAIVGLGGGFAVLLGNYLKSKANLRVQLRLMVYVSVFLAVLIPATNFILPLFFKVNFFVSLSPLYTLILASAVAYAIIFTRLFDIRLVVARSVTYILSILSIGFIYGFIAFRTGNLLFNGPAISTVQQVFNTFLAVILAFTFQPLRRFFERVTDRVFYRDKYDPQVLINDIGRVLAAEIELDPLSHQVIHILTSQMRITSADLVVINQKSIFFEAHAVTASQHTIPLKDLQKLGKNIIIADDLVSGERKDVFTKYNISVSVALRTKEEFIGFLLLGEKRSGDIYNAGDIRVLRILANELAVTIQNAKAYTEIQRFNETLKIRIGEATKQLRTANEHLKELDQAKDEFISMASHQLRTPLTTVKGYVSMMMEGDFGKLNDEQEQSLKQALDGANRMAGLVNDLLNVSRMDAGRFYIDAHETDLNKVITEEVDKLETSAAAKAVKLTYIRPDRPVPIVNLDEDKTRQAIMNLVDNAIYYTPHGQVKVSLETNGHDIIFKVVDNGIGVPKDQKDKLFQKFFRAGNAQTARPDGTGLGLYLVKRVVEDQGGSIIFESTESKGSTFGFSLPKTGAPKQVRTPPSLAQATPLKWKETDIVQPDSSNDLNNNYEPTDIVIAEDDPFISRMYNIKLDLAGYKVSVAASGREAVDIIKASHPRLVLIDIRMPELSGFEVVKLLRHDNYDFSKTAVIFLTNSTKKEDMAEAQALGGEYLVKANLTPKDVLEKINRALKKSWFSCFH